MKKIIRGFAVSILFFNSVFFFVYAWLSHTNVLGGSPTSEGLIGLGVFILSFCSACGWSGLPSKKTDKALSIVFGAVCILHFMTFSTLFAAGLIGPRLVGVDDPEISLGLLFIVYFLLGVFGIFVIRLNTKYD